ncbi:PIG-P [Amanita rubescens]|nr:PIG-P [Amanita rubescens]
MVTNNTSNRSRAPEFHGFVAWTSTALLFVLYLIWALLPDEYIIWLGIRWYPNREWAVLFPSWTVALFTFTYFAYSMLAIARTPSFNDTNSISDRHSRSQTPKLSTNQYDPFLAAAMPGSAPETYDMPIGMINRILYGKPPYARRPGDRITG